MRRVRQRAIGLPGLLFLVALALAPVALSGHWHAAHAARSAPCATCLTVLHAPATSAPPVAHVDPVFLGWNVCDAGSSVQCAGETPVAVGRAPPLAPVPHLA